MVVIKVDMGAQSKFCQILHATCISRRPTWATLIEKVWARHCCFKLFVKVWTEVFAIWLEIKMNQRG